MAKTKTIDNLNKIFIQSYKWRNTDLSDNKTDKKFKLFSFFNLKLFILSIISVLIAKKIDETVLNSILTFASIFATLIIPVIIMVYDKFSNTPNGNLSYIQRKSKGAKDKVKLYKNFTSRFVFTALENVFIAIAIICIIIIYEGFLVEKLNVHPLDYEIQKEISKEGIYLGFEIFIIFLMKSIFVLLFIKFIWFIFYSIGALGDFFQSELREN